MPVRLMLAVGHVSCLEERFALILRKFRRGAGDWDVIFQWRPALVWIRAKCRIEPCRPLRRAPRSKQPLTSHRA